VAEVKKKFDFLRQEDYCGSDSTLVLHKNDVLRYTKADFSEFSKARFSIREFSDEPVPIEKITKAVKTAQKAPSVCNRQSSRVYVLSNRETIDNVFSIHRGNRGFSHLVDKLIIVTSDLAVFYGAGERNQAFIDAGIFSMSLMYGLHNVGLATCPLNWCTSGNNDRRLRRMIKIKDSESIILLLAVGNYRDEFKVAKSTRKPVEEIMSIV
jgi:nitroreductase